MEIKISRRGFIIWGAFAILAIATEGLNFFSDRIKRILRASRPANFIGKIKPDDNFRKPGEWAG